MKVYIAGPLTVGNRTLNIREAFLAAADVMRLGHAPFVPHYYDFMEMIAGQSGDYEAFMKLDFEWLASCDALIRLPGTSSGADREVSLMREYGKPVYFSVREFREAIS